MEERLLGIISAGCVQSVKMLITLEPLGILGSNFAYLFILTVSSHLAGQGLLVKMLIAPVPHHIF